jgi:hypothetical protein
VLLLRGFYGPPIRLLLTAEHDRCRQRLADRLASSPEARAWKALHTIEWLVKGVPESEIPRFLHRDLLRLGEDGIRRLDDARLLFRMDAIAQGFANAEKNGCGSDGWRFLDVLWRVNPHARDVWFDMLFDAIVAEILDGPPCERLVKKKGQRSWPRFVPLASNASLTVMMNHLGSCYAARSKVSTRWRAP